MGDILFEGDGAAYATTRAADENFEPTKHETFQRRLQEARAFGRASNSLASTSPELSAKFGLSAGQRFGAWAMCGAVTFAAVSDPAALWAGFTALLGIVFSLLILMRLAAVAAMPVVRSAQPPRRVADDDLPPLSILIPLYKEDAVVGSLIEAIQKLDYPPKKLDVKLLIEADDEKTLSAIERVQPPPWFETIPVPPGEPRTKPKALNYGLDFTRGEIIAVFDAEDHPSPGQPRAAVAAFRSGPRNLAVVQAPLLIHNGQDGWLTRQFEIEYAIHFRIWLPFLAWLRVPLALGGTSNYFQRDRLTKAGGWDAWNVTEDADLGLRLARFGGAAAMISEPTWEEAPSHLPTWLNQRTRWMKGHLQTWIVLMRQPLAAARGMGIRNFLSVLLTLGGSILASTMHAPILLWLTVGLFTPFVTLEGWQAVLFGMGYSGVLAAAFATRTTHAKLWTLLSLPLYWPLMSIAMLRALYEMKIRPHFWAKTPHGKTPRAR